jgi:hypothetical protein
VRGAAVTEVPGDRRMSWVLSRFRAGDVVEVRSKAEIFATLDEHGCLEGMPFMPEMLQYCGRRFRVSAVAHKTCDTARRTWTGRRLDTAVHLADLRCDGAAHGGCEAACNLFWKDAWLRSADDERCLASSTREKRQAACTDAQLLAQTKTLEKGAEETRYSCQATRLYEATQALAWWDIRQYVLDVLTRNHRAGHVLRVLWLAFLRICLSQAPRGHRVINWIYATMHRRLSGREVPDFNSEVSTDLATPTGRLHLEPGDRVRIKSKEEIGETLRAGKNRGLSFNVEMSKYCGQIATVRACVTRIVDDTTGAMVHMKNPCIILENIVCSAEYSGCRLMCPRAIPSYWREVWLERIERPLHDDRVSLTPSAGSAQSGKDGTADGLQRRL